MKPFFEAREEIIGAVLIAKTDVTRAETERKFEEHRHKLPLFPSFKAGSSDFVKDEDITMLTDLLLSPRVWASSKGGEDEDISWGVDGTDPSVIELDQLVALGAQADKNYAASTARQILPGTAAPARGDTTFSTGTSR